MRTIELSKGTFEIAGLLGKGKSGHSWLIENGAEKYVLKQMHDEPCAYYRFGDKFENERKAYERLAGRDAYADVLNRLTWGKA